MTPNPFGIVRAEFLHGRPRHAIFTVPGGEKASRHPSVEHSIPHVISRVPPRVCVNLSPGYHICSVTPSYATRSVRALLSLSLSLLPPPSRSPSPLHIPIRVASPSSFSLSAVRPSVRPSAICLRFKTSGYLLHCLLTGGAPTRGPAPARTRTHASIFIARRLLPFASCFFFKELNNFYSKKRLQF